MTSTDAITAALAEHARVYETHARTVTVYVDGPYVGVEMTELADAACSRCGQDIADPSGPGPVVWRESDAPFAGQGGHSHQHGCGEWNEPLSVWALLDTRPNDAEQALAVDDGETYAYTVEQTDERAHDLAGERADGQIDALAARLDRDLAEGA